jgi:hypothetical protein
VCAFPNFFDIKNFANFCYLKTEEWRIILLRFKEHIETFRLEVKPVSNAVERERAKLKHAKIRAKCRARKP